MVRHVNDVLPMQVNQLRNGKFGHVKFFETEADPLRRKPPWIQEVLARHAHAHC